MGKMGFGSRIEIRSLGRLVRLAQWQHNNSVGSQLLTSRESETAANCEREVADDQDFLLAAVVGLRWNCALDLCFLRHTITRSSHSQLLIFAAIVIMVTDSEIKAP